MASWTRNSCTWDVTYLGGCAFPSPDPSCTFTASPTTIEEGSSAVLSWTTTNSTLFFIDKIVGLFLTGSGSQTVSPTVTTTYTGTAVGAFGSNSCVATITVTAPPPPAPAPTCVLNASALSIEAGSSTTLSWDTANATSISLNQGIGSVTPVIGGSRSVSPSVTTTYTGTVTGAGGSDTCSRTITVTPPPAPTCTLTASPSIIQTGSASSLEWTTTNATSFVIDHAVGSVTPVAAGSRSVSPSTTTIYSGTATGPGGSTPCTATVTVTAVPVPSCTLTASPASILNGAASSLAWTTTNATSISLSQGIGSVTPVVGGSRSVSPSVTTTYTGTVTGANGLTNTCADTVAVTDHPAPTCTLTASPKTIVEGTASSLAWTTTNTTSFTIDRGVGSVTPLAGGSRSVTPTATTIYSGTATGPGGTVTCADTVTVTPLPPPPPPTCVLTASALSIEAGSSTTLSWDTANATSISLNQGIGSVTPVIGGSRSVSPSVTTTYTGTVTGAGGSDTCSRTITVTPPPAPTCTLTASPSIIQTGSASSLEWTTTNATSFVIDHAVGSVTPVAAGSRSVSPSTTTIYSGTATGPGGSTPCTATVTVTAVPVPSCTLTASPASILNGAASSLAWTTTNATSISLSQGIGSVTPVVGGSRSVSPSVTTTYTGTVTGANGLTNTCADTVAVTDHPAPTCTLTASPKTIVEGTASSLAWTTTNTTSFTIDRGVGSVTPLAGGSRSVTPTATTIYSGTATGPGGTVTCADTVTVSVTPPAPTCTLTATPAAIQQGATSTLSWNTSNATAFSINQGIGAVTSIVSGATSTTPTTTTTYTGTVTGASGASAVCSATVTVTTTPPAPTCTMSLSPTRYTTGGSATLSWGGTNVQSVTIDNGIGATTTIPSSTRVSPTNAQTYTYVGTFTGTNGQTVTCSTALIVDSSGGGGGCSGNCGQPPPSGGGGGSAPPPTVSLAVFPQAQSLAYLYLAQIPQTGLSLGPLGTTLYWLALIMWALAVAYLILFRAVPFTNRQFRMFGARIHTVLNSSESAPTVALAASASPAPTPQPQHTPPPASDAPRTYSTYDGFKSFAEGGSLSIDDIVKGLSRRHASAAAAKEHQNVEPIYENVEPIYENVEPVVAETPAVALVPESAAPASVRGFVAALIEGDRTAVFAGLRQEVRGGGAAEELLSATACLLDDAYRARVDGTPCAPDIARLTARLDTPTLEKLISSLSNAIDSSYSTGVTGAKLALARALAVLGA